MRLHFNSAPIRRGALMFDELLAQQLALRAAREARADRRSPPARRGRLYQRTAARSVTVYFDCRPLA